MKNITKTSLQITIFLFISSIVFFIIALFWYGNFKSIKDFVENFWVYKNITLAILIAIFSILIWFFSRFIIGNIFNKIEENNNKLKDYNHYLAHELKTPISVINSNLEVLSYGFDEKKVSDSKIELKNMIKIIDWLLNFSESFNNLEKVEINVENFIKKLINFKSYKNNIKLVNKEFNFSIFTDEVLFERVINNLIENALKYSPDRSLNIYINSDKLIFENNLYKDINEEELEKIHDKFYSKSCNENTGSGLWIAMIEEIVKVLWYEIIISSKDGKFVVEIVY
jgi:signal transduction histidine kinase